MAFVGMKGNKVKAAHADVAVFNPILLPGLSICLLHSLPRSGKMVLIGPKFYGHAVQSRFCHKLRRENAGSGYTEITDTKFHFHLFVLLNSDFLCSRLLFCPFFSPCCDRCIPADYVHKYCQDNHNADYNVLNICLSPQQIQTIADHSY